MPLDPSTGVFHALHGPADGAPLLVTLPLMASFTEIFGADLAPVQDGYLAALTDRYRVLLVDYPSIGGSQDIAPSELTADRVCADLLGVASAAGFDRFAYAGYSWSAAVGLQLAHRTDRLTALALGGWPPLGGPYAQILAAARRKLPNPEPSSLKILRSAAQYAQWISYYESMLDWSEAESVAALRIPRLIYFGADGDLVSKARESLVSFQRILMYVQQTPNLDLSSDQRNRFKSTLRDVQSLSDHASFLGSKIQFLLDAVLGLINLEQNNIIKIFSVVAVMFLPPTLIASIYGMNFHFMPELDKHWGYPMALVAMVGSAVVPFLYFRRKGWL